MLALEPLEPKLLKPLKDGSGGKLGSVSQRAELLGSCTVYYYYNCHGDTDSGEGTVIVIRGYPSLLRNLSLERERERERKGTHKAT